MSEHITVSERSAMLAAMSPELLPEDYVFCTLAQRTDGGLGALATFQEEEGLSVILPMGEAQTRGMAFDGSFRCLRLNVYSDLQGVGLTAAVAGALADIGISANVVAARHHDYVFVPAPRATDALSCLRALSADHG